MSGNYIYRADSVHQDFIFEIAFSLFYGRQRKKLPLDDAAQKSGLKVEEIDALECTAADLDFSKIIKLLDLYQCKIPVSPEGLDRLPPEWYRQYFDY